MSKFVKFLLVLSIICLTLGAAEKWYTMFLLGRYWEYASFIGTSFVGVIIPMAFIYLASMAITKIVKS